MSMSDTTVPLGDASDLPAATMLRGLTWVPVATGQVMARAASRATLAV